jgi:putative transposase
MPVCRQLGYSKQAYYKSIRTKAIKSVTSKMVTDKVISVRQDMPRLGTRKLHYLLKEYFQQQGIGIGRDKLFDLLRQQNMLISKKKRYTKTTQSSHWMRKYPNLIKDIRAQEPEQIWVADITYLRVSAGCCYLHLITDAYSKRIMGYHISDTLAASETLRALQVALKTRFYHRSLTHHSDRGLQYCSIAYTSTLQKNGITISMTEDGSPYENAIAERVNGILKDEYGLDEVFAQRDQLKKQVAEAIESYNYRRPHQSNHLLTPHEMHQQKTQTPKAWHKKSARTKEGSSRFLPSPYIY